MKTAIVAKILLILSMLIIVSYILFSIVSFSNIDDAIVCKNLEINVLDKEKFLLISQNEVAEILESKKLNPIGKSYKRLKTEYIEKELLKNPTIKSVECYKMLSGKVQLNIEQGIPVFILAGAENFYVDTDRKIIPLTVNHTNYLPVVTGRVTKTFATTDLFEFMSFIAADKFWNAQIEQVFVHDDLKIELVTRVGNAKIMLGTVEEFHQKLDKLFQLYTEGFNKIGWNRYSEIDLRFKNQIVCKKNKLENMEFNLNEAN